MRNEDSFLGFVLGQLDSWGGVSSRKMFGGIGLYRDGKMFGLIYNNTAYLKVDDSNRTAYEEAGSKPFKPYADRPMTMSYYEVPPDVLEDPDKMVQWSEQSLEVQKKSK